MPESVINLVQTLKTSCSCFTFVCLLLTSSCAVRNFQDFNTKSDISPGKEDNNNAQKLDAWLYSRLDETPLKLKFGEDLSKLRSALAEKGIGAHAFETASSANDSFFSLVFPKIKIQNPENSFENLLVDSCFSFPASAKSKKFVAETLEGFNTADPIKIAFAYGLRTGIEVSDLLEIALSEAKSKFNLTQIQYNYSPSGQERLQNKLHIDRSGIAVSLSLTGKGTEYQENVMSDDFFQVKTGRYLFFVAKTFAWQGANFPKAIWHKAPDDIRQDRATFVFRFEKTDDSSADQKKCN